MQTMVLAIIFIALFFVLMSVRLIFLKDGKFKGTCASQSPFLNPEGKKCSFCGDDPTKCKTSKTEENEVLKVLNLDKNKL